MLFFDIYQKYNCILSNCWFFAIIIESRTQQCIYITKNTHWNALMNRTARLHHGSEEEWNGKVIVSSLFESICLGYILLCGCGASRARFYWTLSQNFPWEMRRDKCQTHISLQHILGHCGIWWKWGNRKMKWRPKVICWELRSWSWTGSGKDYP